MAPAAWIWYALWGCHSWTWRSNTAKRIAVSTFWQSRECRGRRRTSGVGLDLNRHSSRWLSSGWHLMSSLNVGANLSVGCRDWKTRLHCALRGLWPPGTRRGRRQAGKEQPNEPPRPRATKRRQRRRGRARGNRGARRRERRVEEERRSALRVT